MELSAKELAPLVRHQLIAKYFNVTSAVVLVFDTLDNFADEVELIWCQRWSVGKALYIASRYLAFIDLSLMLLYLFESRLDPRACHRLYEATTYFALIGACIAETVLLIRVYAIWKHSLRILVFLSCMSLSLFLASILNFAINNNITKLPFIPSPVPIIIPCFPLSVHIRAIVDFGCLVLLDLTVLILTAWGGFRHWKEGASSPLIITFYRDGVLYYVCLFPVSFANMILFSVGDPQQQGYLLQLQLVLHSVLSARIILNLRKHFIPTADDGRTGFSTAVFGELVSDPSLTTGNTTILWIQEEEEGIELQDMNPA